MTEKGTPGMHLFTDPPLPGSRSIARSEMVYRLHWFIRLRWIAAASVIVLPLFISEGVGLTLPALRLTITGMVIGGYNLLFLAWLRWREGEMTERLAAIMANLQISVDLVALTCVLHLSGGVENPLVAYYIFHVIIAATLVSMPAAYAQATLALLLFAGMTGAEATGLLHHYHILGLSQEGTYDTYIAWLIVAAVASTLYVTAFLSVPGPSPSGCASASTSLKNSARRRPSAPPSASLPTTASSNSSAGRSSTCGA